MIRLNKSATAVYLTVTLLLILAYLCRFLRPSFLSPKDVGLIRSGIYIGLYIAWGFSIRNRIIQPQARRHLSAIAALMVFWFVVRTIKYHFASEVATPHLYRYLWYAFYPPMLFIPLLAIFVTMSVGAPEDFRLPKQAALLSIPTALLVLLVMTNDLHQLVFTFPADLPVWTDDNYGYAAGYFCIVGWLAFCALLMLGMMLHKCRVPRSRKRIWLPLLPICAMILYTVLHYSQAPWLRYIAGDMTAVTCLGYASTLELCVQSGLIQSNTHYRELFMSCTLRVQLTGADFQPLMVSRSAEPIAPQAMLQTQAGPVQLEGGLRLSSAPVRGGHVFWSEDVSELLSVLEELQDAKDALEDSNALLRAEYTLRVKEAHIAEQDRLYNLIQQETAPRIKLLADLTEEFEAAHLEEDRKRLLGKMTVIGAYLKRRSNLIFLADKTPLLQAKELSLTFGESLDNLELCGVTCGFSSEVSGTVEAAQLMELYDFFEEVVERSLGSMSTMAVRIRRAEGQLLITITTDARAGLSSLAAGSTTVLQDEDGEWLLCMRPCPGGAAQ